MATRSPAPNAGLSLRALALLAILALAGAWSSSSARADGDPASDVLAEQPVFLPQDANLSSAQALQLDALAREAARAGYPIRVALVASAADLGSVTELWRKPQTYAEFLAQELGLVYHGPVLIVMPDGLGFADTQHPLASALPAGLRRLAPGAELRTTAIAAVRRLAAAAGHPLILPNATLAARAGSTGDAPWIALAAGIAIVALAWTLSLRARPLSLPGR